MTQDNLPSLRSEIDKLDVKLVQLLAKRMDIVRRVGAYKKEHAIAPLDPARWNEVLESKISLAKKLDVDPEMVKDIYERIHEAALKMESAI